jgi:hypothetical protein
METVEYEAVRGEGIRAALRRGGLFDADELVAVSAIPLGTGQTADTFRLQLTWRNDRAPPTMIAKLPSSDPRSSATATSLGAYERECRFYVELLPRLHVQTPALYGIFQDTQGVANGVILEDLSEQMRSGAQLESATVRQVRSALAQLVRLQAPFWEQSDFAATLPWLHRRLGVPLPHLFERMRNSWAASRGWMSEVLDPSEAEVIDRFVPNAESWALNAAGPWTLTHHDFRLDNLLLDSTDQVTVLDWQTVGWGPAMFDFCYLIGTALVPETRRSSERALITSYLDDLEKKGVNWSYDEAWTSYQQCSFAVLLMLVPSVASLKQTDRGNSMFAGLIQRGARQVLDSGSLDFLPRKGE